MASQTPTTKQTGHTDVKDKPSPKRGIKNPFIFAGTVVILIITIVAFVFLPASGTSLQSQSAPRFGMYNRTPITYVPGGYFATQVQQYNDYLRQQGIDAANATFYAFQVWRSAFESTVLRTAAIDASRSAGYHVSQDALDEAMTKNQAFFVDGKFSPSAYRNTPLSRKMELRTTTEQDLYASRYYSDVASSRPGTKESEFIASMASKLRTIEYAAFSLDSFPDSALAAWAATNAGLFRKVSISRITITSSEADAKKVLKQVKDQTLTFEEAAKSHSKDAYADKGGDPGSLYFHDFQAWFQSKDDAEKVAALPAGEVSDVLKIADKTWDLFKVNTAITEAALQDPATREEIRSYVKNNERGMMETWAIEQAKAFAAAAPTGSMAAAAAKAGAKAGSAGPFPINWKSPSFAFYGQSMPLFGTIDTSKAPELTGAQDDEKFFSTVFSLTPGTLSEPLVLGNEVLVVKVTAESEAKKEDTSMLAFAYPYFYQGTFEPELKNHLLTNNPKFKDEFAAMFAKIFTPKTEAASSN
jgi:parvulin-like peptidyl-prolyl isomerase